MGHTLADAPPLTSRDRELLILMFRAGQDLKRGIAHALDSYGLTGPQFGTLQTLRMMGAVPMHELAVEICCDASNLTGIVDRLEQRGFLERQIDPQDRRIKRLILTDRGRDTADEVWDAAFSNTAIIALPEGAKNALREALSTLDSASRSRAASRLRETDARDHADGIDRRRR